jgi:hypothetical protein
MQKIEGLEEQVHPLAEMLNVDPPIMCRQLHGVARLLEHSKELVARSRDLKVIIM